MNINAFQSLFYVYLKRRNLNLVKLFKLVLHFEKLIWNIFPFDISGFCQITLLNFLTTQNFSRHGKIWSTPKPERIFVFRIFRVVYTYRFFCRNTSIRPYPVRYRKTSNLFLVELPTANMRKRY